MTSVERFDLAELAPTPWKNGLGTTREIINWPPGADLDTFLWRVSVASIVADAPFSPFPGVDRTIMLLTGDGIWLRGDTVNQQIHEPYHPVAFSGDEAVHCTLLGNASTDFNVMTRRGQAQASITMPTTPTVIAGDHGVVLGSRGSWSLGSTLLPPDSGVRWSGTARQWHVSRRDAATVLTVVTFRETRMRTVSQPGQVDFPDHLTPRPNDHDPQQPDAASSDPAVNDGAAPADRPETETASATPPVPDALRIRSNTRPSHP